MGKKITNKSRPLEATEKWIQSWKLSCDWKLVELVDDGTLFFTNFIDPIVMGNYMWELLIKTGVLMKKPAFSIVSPINITAYNEQQILPFRHEMNLISLRHIEMFRARSYPTRSNPQATA